MKKHILVMILFFIVISLSLSTLVGSFDLFIYSINGEEFVRIELEKVEDIDEVITSLRQLDEFSNNKMEYKGERGNYIIDVIDTHADVSLEMGKLFNDSSNADVIISNYNYFNPSDDKSNLILVYIGLFIVLVFGMFGVYRQILKIKLKIKEK